MSELIEAYMGNDVADIIRATKAKTYCGDVCTRCGASVNNMAQGEQ